jgi:putative transposase
MKRQLESEKSPLLDQLTIRQRPGITTFRFWQEGAGYDLNLTSAKAILASIDYVHLNPVRRKLCAAAIDWRWSSARWYQSEGKDVDLSLPTLTAFPAGFFCVGGSEAI